MKRRHNFTIKNKNLTLTLSSLREPSPQTSTEKELKRTSGFLKAKKISYGYFTVFKIFYLMNLLPCVSYVHKFEYGRCNASYYGETDKHLKVKSEEHIASSPLTFNKVKLSIEIFISQHLLFFIILLPLLISPLWLMGRTTFF